MSQKKDYYEVLGLSRDASVEDIKKAYRKKARHYHPDISKEQNAEQKFKEVQEAYEVLVDPEKKNYYDNFGHQANNYGDGNEFSGFNQSNFTDINDIFSSFFGTQSEKKRSKSSSGNSDISVEMNIDFMEAVLGCKKLIQIVVENYCHECDGTGAKSSQDIIFCSYCKGQGTVIIEQRSLFGNIRTQQICSKCRGEGSQIKLKCSGCYGKKFQKYKKTVEVNIPAGVDNDNHLIISNKGHYRNKNYKPGDLIIYIKTNTNSDFDRKGQDIYTTVFITFAQAALGVVLSVKTINGVGDLKIPAGIQSGTKLRLSNQGIPYINKSLKGHHYITVNIETPKNLSFEQKKIFQKLAILETTQNKNKNKSWFF